MSDNFAVYAGREKRRKRLSVTGLISSVYFFVPRNEKTSALASALASASNSAVNSELNEYSKDTRNP